MSSERTLDVLKNYITKYENSTEDNHVRLVAFARRRLAEGLAPRPIAPYNKWDESATVTSAGRVSPSSDPLFTDDESSYTTRYTRYTSTYTVEEPKTSIFATVCKNILWKGMPTPLARPSLSK